MAIRIIKGATRIVILLGNRAYKIPNFTYSWLHFILGIKCNIMEYTIYRWNSGNYSTGKEVYLCPVLWSSWGGWIICMPRVNRTLTKEEFKELDLTAYIKAWPGDDKHANYGLLNGKIVKIDYGDLDTPRSSEAVSYTKSNLNNRRHGYANFSGNAEKARKEV